MYGPKSILCFAIVVSAALASIAATAEGPSSGFRFYRVDQAKEVPSSEAVAHLSRQRIILVGEHHSREDHHSAQLAVIRALQEAGANPAIGLEMFRKQDQQALDDWVAGRIPESSFEKIYYDNWNFDWPLYRPIFLYAREHRIPMFGLNVDRSITRQVAREGFKSLGEDQKGSLSDVVCRVDSEYLEFIRKAFGEHGHSGRNFEYFCEAQLVWDTAMAIHALEFLGGHPDKTAVLLAGSGHARKGGIPRRIKERSDLPFLVMLPEASGSIEPGQIDEKDADYILLQEEK